MPKDEPRAGWVFRIEVVTKNVAVKTINMVKEISKRLSESENIDEILIEELYGESIKLFEKPKEEGEEE